MEVCNLLTLWVFFFFESFLIQLIVVATVIQHSEYSPHIYIACMRMIFMETVDSYFIYLVFTGLLLTTVNVAFTMDAKR